MDNILKQLTAIKNELHKPFPYTDTDKIQKDYQTEFNNLSVNEDNLTADFNTYCMNISGTLSYVLAGNINNIPKGQIETLQNSFFDSFKQYKFFEEKGEFYNDFFQEYKKFEHTRKLLLRLLSHF